MNRIVVVIEGGCLRSVYCNEPNVEVELIDFDNVENGVISESDLEKAVECAGNTLTEVF